MLNLYVSESCPYCKKVMNYMEENKILYNKVDTSNEDNVLKLLTIGGKDQVPFLYNDRTDDRIYESDDIIEYVKNRSNNE